MNNIQKTIFDKYYNIYLKKSSTLNKNILLDKLLFLSILIDFISDKEIFKRNKQVADFLDVKLDIKFPEYVKKSRPLLIGKTINHYMKLELTSYDNELNIIYKAISNVLNNKDCEKTWEDVIRKITL